MAKKDSGFTVIPGEQMDNGADASASDDVTVAARRQDAAVQTVQDMMTCCLIGLCAREQQMGDRTVLRSSRSYDAGSLERLQEKGLIEFRKGSSMLTLTEFGDKLGNAFFQLVGEAIMAESEYEDDDMEYETFSFSLELQLDGRVCTRTIRVPKTLYFDEFHVAIQCAFGWADYHMYDFCLTSGGKKLFVFDKGRGCIDAMFSPVPTGRVGRDAADLQLADVFPRTRTAVYSYDYGDGWEVKVRYVGSGSHAISEAFACEGGEGDAPPEDVGGIYGFEDFLRVMADPDDPEHKELAEWAEDQGFRHFHANVVTEDLRDEFFGDER